VVGEVIFKLFNERFILNNYFPKTMTLDDKCKEEGLTPEEERGKELLNRLTPELLEGYRTQGEVLRDRSMKSLAHSFYKGIDGEYYLIP